MKMVAAAAATHPAPAPTTPAKIANIKVMERSRVAVVDSDKTRRKVRSSNTMSWQG
jgi:hypothetical protein